MSVLTKNNYIKANALMSYSDISYADSEVLQQTATDMGYDEFSYNDSGDLLLKKTEVVGSYTYVTTFNCRTEGVGVTVTEVSPNIVFADPDVKAILATAYGSNGEITEEQAAAVTTWFSGSDSSTNPFYKNQNVNTFDEFSYFTGITEIGSSAFYWCMMTSITIPASVTTIGNGAFARNMLTSITIPASVTTIGDYAFSENNSLTTIICEATTPPTLGGNNVFNIPNEYTIYVPAASVDAYKSAWSSYANRIQAITEPEN